jgi:superfamily II DNA or RNA helicase
MAATLPSRPGKDDEPPPIGTLRAERGENRQHQATSLLQNLHAREPRGASWCVHGVDSYAACHIVTLTPGCGERGALASLALIVPFDRITPVRRTLRWCACGMAQVSTGLAVAVRDAVVGGAGHLLRPDLALVPWQWAAATTLLHGDASALLLADAVGLGKTIQAGIVVAALRARDHGSRVLILTPAGLRDQWHSELARLFRFSVSIVDAAWLRDARRTMPADVNPWSVASTAIASIDFVKQPEVLAAATGAPWDVLIVDEAHNLSSSTDRRAAAAALAACARHVVLLTATPHTGSDGDFDALCSVGDVAGDHAQTLLIRRTREDVGLEVARRVRVSRLPLDAAEQRMHALLRDYAGTVWRERGMRSPAARLAMTVLLKRSASSAGALARSVAHRLRLLRSGNDAPEQPVLPFDEPGETDATDTEMPAALGEPGLDEHGRELELLAALGDAAQLAAASESKLARVSTLLRRTREPAIVFTEYRDTLDAALRALRTHGPVAVLHGGLSRLERREAEDAFNGGRARVLLATDVASEGLNLHGRCRLVINLELPWSPVRLEQRVGRVDRIGQRRRVHALHLIGRDTAEEYVLERFTARVRNIRRSLGATYEGVAFDDTLLAAGAVGAAVPDMQGAPPTGAAYRRLLPPDRDERGVCELLDAVRRLATAAQQRHAGTDAGDHLPVAIVRPRQRARLALPPGVVLGFRVEARSAAGRPAASAVIAIHVALPSAALSRARPSTLLAALLPIAGAAASRAGAGSLVDDLHAHHRYTARAAAREAALRAAASGDEVAGRAVQPSLFDRRAVHQAARQREAREHRSALHTARLAQLARGARVDDRLCVEPILALVLR